MADIKPLILDETGKEIAKRLKEQNAVLGMIAKKQTSILNDWDSVADIVDAGNAENIFSVGALLTDKYTNVDSSNTVYDCPWHINDFRDFETESGETVHGMILQMKYATLQLVQFSGYRAFLACPDGLSAGTYSVSFGATWGKSIKGSIYSFTLTKAVPKGGRLGGFRGNPDQTDQSKYAIYSYAADGKTLNEQVMATKVSAVAGTNLGTLNADSRNGNLNSMQECGYGCNRWKTSAYRQWLNSEAGKDNWWVAQDAWDIAPETAISVSGFLAGLPEEMRNRLKRVKVTTVCNNPTEKGAVDITYDKVFLPALEEMYISKQSSNEGTYHKYWKLRAGTSSPVPLYTNNDRYINYALDAQKTAQYIRLRSALTGVACHTWYVNPFGVVGDGYGATGALRSLPIIVI